jgi:hypothetical protein
MRSHYDKSSDYSDKYLKTIARVYNINMLENKFDVCI